MLAAVLRFALEYLSPAICHPLTWPEHFATCCIAGCAIGLFRNTIWQIFTGKHHSFPVEKIAEKKRILKNIEILPSPVPVPLSAPPAVFVDCSKPPSAVPLIVRKVKSVLKFSFFDKMPKEVFASILREWISAADLGALDTSMSSKDLRTYYLRSIQHSAGTVFNGVNKEMRDNYLIWLAKKSVCVKHLKISAEITTAALINTLLVSPKLKFLEVNYPGKNKHCLSMTDQCLTLAIDRCPELLVLHLGSCTQISDQSILALAETCTRLKSLFLFNCCHVSPQAIIRLVQSNRDLIFINLASCFVTDDEVCKIAENCHKLQLLHLSDYNNITSTALVKIAENCPALHSFKVSCFDMQDAFKVGMKKILRHCKYLSFLNLSYTSFGEGVLEEIITVCPHIRSLNLMGCQNVSVVALIMIGEICAELQNLNVGAIVAVNLSVAIKILRSCTELQCLVMAGCSIGREELKTLKDKFPNVRLGPTFVE